MSWKAKVPKLDVTQKPSQTSLETEAPGVELATSEAQSQL